MKIGVTGWRGRVGAELISRGHVPLTLEVRNFEETYNVIQESDVDIVIHCAAMTDVDWCENKENFNEVFAVNCRGVNNVVDACSRQNKGMILLSTDHVFDGKRLTGTYSEKDIPNPINLYGRSKLGAEGLVRLSGDNIKTVRTSVLYGSLVSIPYIVDRIFEKDIVEVPSMINRTFLSIGHFVDGLEMYLQSFHKMPKLLHISGTERLSWYEFVLGVASELGMEKSDFHPRTRYIKDEFAPRPKNGGLNVSLARTLGIPLYSGLNFK